MGNKYSALRSYPQERERQMDALSTQPQVLRWYYVQPPVRQAFTACRLQGLWVLHRAGYVLLHGERLPPQCEGEGVRELLVYSRRHHANELGARLRSNRAPGAGAQGWFDGSAAPVASRRAADTDDERQPVCLVRRGRLADSQLLWIGVRYSRRCSLAIMYCVPQSVFITF